MQFLFEGLKIPGQTFAAEGGIFLVDLSVPEINSITALKLKIIPSSNFDEEKFHPAGISTFEATDGRIFLYASSISSEQIDAFEISIADKTAKHFLTIRDPFFHAVDDLILVSENSFYVTNFLRFQNPILQSLEMAFKVPSGSVIFYDGKKAKKVLTGLRGPNGIALSADKKKLFLTATLAKELHVYEILPDFSLKLEEIFFLFTAADNLNVDDSGAIWTGAHPISYQVGLHFLDPANTLTPSQVLKIEFSDEKSKNPPQITEIFADPGNNLKGSSAAVRFKDRLLVGTMFDKLLLCELKCE